MDTVVDTPHTGQEGSRFWLWRWVWLVPFVLTLTFALEVAIWSHRNEALEIEEERRTLIADTLSLGSRIEDWLTMEEQTVQELAASLDTQHIDDDALLRAPAITKGLQRLWISVVALDASNRLLAQVPQAASQTTPKAPVSSVGETSVSAHLASPVVGGGRLIVRFDPAALLRKTVPWWLSRRYDVRLVDDFGQNVATTGDALPPRGRQTHRLSMEPQMPDTYLELSTRDARGPWWRSMPLGLMAAFLALSAWASWALRQQMILVARAKDRWRAEAAWRQAIEESLTVGLRARDLQGRVVHVNRAFCDLVGYPAEQLVGQLPPMPYWLPDTIEDTMKRHQRNLAGQAPREGYETRFRRADGVVLDIMMFETPWVNASGQQIGWMGSFVDISSSKQAQERERRHLETLANQARLTMLGEVASALAHQLNQPLAAVASYNAGVLRSLENQGYQNTLVLDAMRLSVEQVEEAGRIVKGIRSFLTRRAPQRESCDVAHTIERTLALLRHDLQQRGLKVETVLPTGLPRVWADPVLIEQVLINLLRNAADALASHPQPRLRVAAQCQGACFVSVQVDDNGPGVGTLSIDELASPFHSTKADGMGMGLAICRTVVEAHHGALSAGASPWGGARFAFTLPIEMPEGPA